MAQITAMNKTRSNQTESRKRRRHGLRVLFSWVVLLSLGWTSPETGPAAAQMEDRARAAFDQKNPFELTALIPTLHSDQPLSTLYRGYLGASLRDTEGAVMALTQVSQDNAIPLKLRAQAVEILAGVMVREGRYAEAVKWLESHLSDYASVIGEETRKGAEQTLSVAKVLALAPHQQTFRQKNGSITRTRDKVGLSNVPLTINDSGGKAVFDTGANFCVATETAAKRLGLSGLEGTVKVQAATGKAVEGRMAIAKSLILGECEFRNVAFIVFQDQDLAFPQIDYAIELIIGFPVIVQLGCLQVHQDSIDIVDSSANLVPSNLALDSLTPHVAVTYENRTLPFLLDTGATHSELFSPFVRLFPDVMKDAMVDRGQRAGAGGADSTAQQTLRPVTAMIGKSLIVLTLLHQTEEGEEATGQPFGVIGNDILFHGSGYELDFRTMHFRLLEK